MNLPSTSPKKKFLELILAALNSELEVLAQSARSAQEAAVHEESRAEDSHDTRGLEASYLAGAQNARIEDLKRTVAYFQFTPTRDFKAGDAIEVGALLELSLDSKTLYYFLTSRGGGRTIQFEGHAVQLISPQSPIGEELSGKCVGDEIEVEGQQKTRVYKILSVI